MHHPPQYWLPTSDPNVYRSERGDAIQYIQTEILYFRKLGDAKPFARYPLNVSQEFLELASKSH